MCLCAFTGRANLPGSVAERQLLESFSRMLPELLRFSSANHLLSVIPEALQEHHRRKKDAVPQVVIRSARQAALSKTKPQQDLWEGWEDSAPMAEAASDASEQEEEEAEMDLDGLGL